MKYHQILFEILESRESDYDTFLNKLYEAITGDFKQIFIEEFTKDENYKEILDSMIHYFEIKEEFEKCQKLLDLLTF